MMISMVAKKNLGYDYQHGEKKTKMTGGQFIVIRGRTELTDLGDSPLKEI